MANFRKHFKEGFIRATNIFQCLFRCSSLPGVNYFIFFKTVCQCISNTPLIIDLSNLYCLKSRCTNSVENYCYSEYGLTIFLLEDSVKDGIPPKVPPELVRYLYRRCLEEEISEYKMKRESICLHELSTADCSDLNVIFLGISPSNLFLQWICKRKNGTDTKYFRIFQKKVYQTSSTRYVSTTDDSSAATSIIEVTNDTSSEHDPASRTLYVTTVETCHSTSYFDFLDWSDFNINFVIATVVIAVLVIIVMALARIICQMKKKLKVALFTNLTVDRVQYPYSGIPRLQPSTRSYMEILPMLPIVHSENEQTIVKDIIQQENTDTERYIKSDESEGTGHYQFVP